MAPRYSQKRFSIWRPSVICNLQNFNSVSKVHPREGNLHLRTKLDWNRIIHSWDMETMLFSKWQAEENKKRKQGRKKDTPNSGKLAICPDHPRRRIKIKLCMVGDQWCVVIHVKCDPNRLRGYGAVGVWGRKWPCPITLASDDLPRWTRRQSGVAECSRRNRASPGLRRCMQGFSSAVWHSWVLNTHNVLTVTVTRS